MWIYLSISSYTWEGETTRNEHWAGVVIPFFFVVDWMRVHIYYNLLRRKATMNEKQDRNLHLVMQRIRKKKTKGAQISVRYSNRGDFVF